MHTNLREESEAWAEGKPRLTAYLQIRPPRCPSGGPGMRARCPQLWQAFYARGWGAGGGRVLLSFVHLSADPLLPLGSLHSWENTPMSQFLGP